MLIRQTHPAQGDVFIFLINGEEVCYPLFRDNTLSEARRLETLSSMRPPVRAYLKIKYDLVLNKISEYQTEHGGIPPRELMTLIRTGYFQDDASNYNMTGYC